MALCMRRGAGGEPTRAKGCGDATHPLRRNGTFRVERESARMSNANLLD